MNQKKNQNLSETLVDLDRVTFAYSGETKRQVLNLPSWKVATGESVLLIGDSGSGKSTLLNLLSGILVPDNGSITIAGQAIEKLSNRQRDKYRAKQIGYVTQSFNLIPYLCAVDNIKLANYFASNTKQKNHDSTMESLLSELNIIHDQWHKPVNQLSIGQQQRVAIARAMINRPKLIIADEPTSSLDQNNRDNFMSILMETAKTHKMTLIFVSHDLSLSKYFDRTDSMSQINQLGA